MDIHDYSEDYSRVCGFIPLKQNQVTEPFRVFRDYTIADDIHYTSYDNHCQTRLLDDISFYSRWLTYESRLMYPHLTE